MHGTTTFLTVVAAFMDLCQDLGWMPDASRLSYVYPIPKSGSGGATLEGARQICMVEVLVKLMSAGITRLVEHEWESRQYLHPAQHGFRHGRNAASTAAAVAAVMGIYRRRGSSLYMIAADIEKAFQAVPHAAPVSYTHLRAHET